MFTISFKNVGQGDTIILEWDDGNSKKVAIIDSHIYNYRNPALEFLKANHQLKAIEFYILTHAHYDHFSGISDVLEYCYRKGIAINSFYHTLSGNIVQIFSRTNSTMKAKAAEKLLLDFDKYYSKKSKVIKESIRIDNKRETLKLNDKYSLNFLSPNQGDYFKLEKAIGRYICKKTNTKPQTNSVSTILKITSNNEYILLTSDAMKSRIGRIEPQLFSFRMILGQVPHHGSVYNHRKQFWETVNREKECRAVFSTGHDPADCLPHEITVREIHDLGYKIHSTNQVNGICDVFGNPPTKGNSNSYISDLLDLFSESVPNSMGSTEDDINGDQVFNLW